MRTIVKTWLVVAMWLLVPRLALSAGAPVPDSLSNDDLNALKICEGVTQLFQQFPDSVWPGYDLAKIPYVFYMPDKWALLVNAPARADGFEAYPAGWPKLGTKALLHRGKYDDLAGQLGFDLEIDSLKVVAVPFAGKTDVADFTFVVHEAFHQFQRAAFGEIPWEREEKYPIEDRENTALAALEMRILMNALESVKAGNEDACSEAASEFVAVRQARWARDPFVAAYEQGQEINEGTAYYVESRAVSLMAGLKYKSSLSHVTTPLVSAFAGLSMPEYLLRDFAERITDSSVSPEDMRRNRIYPVGASEGLLLDHYRIDWKPKAQQAGTEFIFAGLLREHLKLDSAQMPALLNEGKRRWGYEGILAASDKLIAEYRKGFESELEAFEAQAGYRVEVTMNAKSLRRSRMSSSKAWIADRGTRQLQNYFDVYTLSGSDLQLELHDVGVLEQDNWDTRRKTVVAFVPDISSILVDGKSLKLADITDQPFQNTALTGTGLKLAYSKPGKLTVAGKRVTVNLVP